MMLRFVKVDDYKKFAVVAIQSDGGQNLYYFGQHGCDNSINTVKQKTEESCKREIDTFWEKYGVCPDLEEIMKEARESGRYDVNAACSAETIESPSKGSR